MPSYRTRLPRGVEAREFRTGRLDAGSELRERSRLWPDTRRAGSGELFDQRRVEHMQGRIGFAYEVGKRSTVWIDLPGSGKPLTPHA